MEVKLIAKTVGSNGESAELVCGSAARGCYSVKPSMDLIVAMNDEKMQKTLSHAIEGGHTSVLEHMQFTFSVEGVSRVLTHQLVRHRIGVGFCISGDTVLRTSSGTCTIRDYFNKSPLAKHNTHIRCVDEKTGNLRYNTPLNVIYSGVKPTFLVKTIHGYHIRSTKDHMFLTESGWKRLEDIAVGTKVYVNGIENYKDKDWLYEQYHIKNLSLKEIGLMCGVGKDCIRSWVRKHGIQKEAGTWNIGRVPPNKGKTKETYEPMARTSAKMMGNKNCPHWCKEDNPSWKGDNVSESGLRQRTVREYYPNRKNVCEWCGFEGVTEFHHLNKNLEEYDTNIVELCVACHKAVHHQEVTSRIILSEITSIEYYGEEDTYDLEMPEPNHNFIANGFVVHNSQQSMRYVDVHKLWENMVIPDSIGEILNDEYIMSETHKDEELANVIENYKKGLADLISTLDKHGIPSEDIRYFVPNGVKANITVTLNGRAALSFCALRCCTRAQKEIRELANAIASILKEECPYVFQNIGASCVQKGYCPEKESCGRKPTLIQILNGYSENARIEK